ncbi:unnamed protein product [Cylicostephanus goldi]|uniref:BPTI/Kunitz inhibitor domain-containing protein n=1 Tax=Cylicostephanus goldi TaxID=71465 RepID=A0A3P6T9I3_CYLGO|nr:unnamed protein product [Cylicostephanus goldi]
MMESLEVEPYEELPDSKMNYQCLLPKEIGTCKETYPFYFFDRDTKTCQPFSYSGCGGNENRFMTLSQCTSQCEPFTHMTNAEMDCFLPLDEGFGNSDKKCLENSGFRFYYSEKEGLDKRNSGIMVAEEMPTPFTLMRCVKGRVGPEVSK